MSPWHRRGETSDGVSDCCCLLSRQSPLKSNKKARVQLQKDSLLAYFVDPIGDIHRSKLRFDSAFNLIKKKPGLRNRHVEPPSFLPFYHPKTCPTRPSAANKVLLMRSHDTRAGTICPFLWSGVGAHLFFFFILAAQSRFASGHPSSSRIL